MNNFISTFKKLLTYTKFIENISSEINDVASRTNFMTLNVSMEALQEQVIINYNSLIKYFFVFNILS